MLSCGRSLLIHQLFIRSHYLFCFFLFMSTIPIIMPAASTTTAEGIEIHFYLLTLAK